MTDAPEKPRPLIAKVAQWGAMGVTLFLLFAHVFKWGRVQVDSITLGLLGVLLIIPVIEFIRKIKFGEFEAEIGKDDVAKAEAKVATELASTQDTERTSAEERILELVNEDPRLALAKVRIDIEEGLRRLLSAAGKSEPEVKRLPLGRLVDTAVKGQMLTAPVGEALRDVIGLANRAIHGERVDSEAATELALLGTRLTRELQEAYVEKAMSPVETIELSGDEVANYYEASYKVTTVVPLVEKPVKNVYHLTQDTLESFLEGYEEHAEFVVAVERIKDSETQPNKAVSP